MQGRGATRVRAACVFFSAACVLATLRLSSQFSALHALHSVVGYRVTRSTVVYPVLASAAVSPSPLNTSYTSWRPLASVPFKEWLSQFQPPEPAWPQDDEFYHMQPLQRQTAFNSCIASQAGRLAASVLTFKPVVLSDIQREVRRELDARAVTVTLVLFWGRSRYVRLLWLYVRRNIKAAGGVIDKVFIVTDFRDRDPSVSALDLFSAVEWMEAERIPHTIRTNCGVSFGCVYNTMLTDDRTVYVKLDDDIIFVKDGSFEHLVYRALMDAQYLVYSGGVVNNPHSWAVHQFIGAHPPVTYHWRSTGCVPPTHLNTSLAPGVYYGANNGDEVGSQAHEGFITNAAIGRLDMYSFGLWDMNKCRCGLPQPQLLSCDDNGYYRWSINAICWTRNRSLPITAPFDEPFITQDWPALLAPHRSAIVGETLFVHCQYTNHQRFSKPDYGLRDEVLIPWYTELARQYTSTPFGQWQGNRSLLDLYEGLAYSWGEERFGLNPATRFPKDGVRYVLG